MLKTKKSSRMEILYGFIISLLLAVGLYLFLTTVYSAVEGNNILTSFGDIQLGTVEYVIMDISQLTFLFSPLSCAVMMILSLFGAYLERRGSKYMGTGVGGNGHIFNIMLAMAIVSVIISELIYTYAFGLTGFVPTLASFLFFHHLVMFYGVNTKKIISILLVTSLLATPICFITRVYLVDPLGLPLFVSVTVGALVFMPIAHFIFKLMPWMTKSDPKPEVAKPNYSPNVWFIHKLFGDIAETGVNGSSIAGMGLVLFTVISYLLNPLSTGAGAGIFPITIFSMMVTGALAIFIYYPYYNSKPILSFTGILVVAAVIVTYPASWLTVACTIVYAAIVPTPVTGWILKVSKYKGDYCIFPLIMIAVSATAIPWCLFVDLVLSKLV